MARPVTQNLNRATGASAIGRTRQAPGLSVQAPLNVNVGPNSFQALAEVLGVATGIVTDESRQRVEERVQDEREMLEAKAAADVYGGTVDEEEFLKSRTYARRVEIVRGQRAAFELGQRLSVDRENYRKDNPLASDKEMEDYLRQQQQTYLQDPEFADIARSPRALSIAQEHLSETSFRLMAGDRQEWLANLKTTGQQDAGAALMARARETKQVSLADLQNAYIQMRATGSSVDEANKAIAEAALGLASEFDNPDPLKLLPDKWPDGSVAPKGDGSMTSWIDGHVEVLTKRAEAARLEGLTMDRVKFREAIDEKIRQGIAPTEDEKKRAIELGFEDGSIAGWTAAARNEIERQAAEAEREQKKEIELQEKVATLQTSPFELNNSDAEKVYGELFNRAPPNSAERDALVIRAVQERGVLPDTYRNYISKVPTNPQVFLPWTGQMRRLRELDEQVYASLPATARVKFAAWEALKSTGKYSDQKAFDLLQVSNPNMGNEVAQSKEAKALVLELTGGNPTGNGAKVARELITGFGSMEFFSREQALEMAEASFKKSYFVHEGQTYSKAFGRSPQFVDWSKNKIARDLALQKRLSVDPDDVVLAPVGDGSQWSVSERGGLPLAVVSSSDLYRAYLEERKTKKVRPTTYSNGRQVVRPGGRTTARPRIQNEAPAARTVKRARKTVE